MLLKWVISATISKHNVAERNFHSYGKVKQQFAIVCSTAGFVPPTIYLIFLSP